MSEDTIEAMSRANDKLKIAGTSLDALGREAGSTAQSLRLFIDVALMTSSIVDGALVTETFPELSKQHDSQAGTREYSNPQAARVHFAQVMQAHGYRPGGNRTWLKAGFAAVMEPN